MRIALGFRDVCRIEPGTVPLKISTGTANIFTMRSTLFGVAWCLVVTGCNPMQAPTPLQGKLASNSAIEAEPEEIVPADLAGMWTGDKGGVLTFDRGHHATAHFRNESETIKGEYRVENGKLLLNGKSLGTIEMVKAHVLRLSSDKAHAESFNLVAQG